MGRRRRRAPHGAPSPGRSRRRRWAGRARSSWCRRGGRRSSAGPSARRPPPRAPPTGSRRRERRRAAARGSPPPRARPSRSRGWWACPCRRCDGRRTARRGGDGRPRARPRRPRDARAVTCRATLSHAPLTTNGGCLRMAVPQRPKVERYDKHLFVVLRTMRLADGEVAEEQVSLFFGAGWLITVQERPDGDCFGFVREAIRQGRGRVREAGTDYLAYLIIDSVVDAYFPVIEQFGERIQHLESAAIDDPNPIVLVQMQRLRHQLLTLRRAVWPMRGEIGILQPEG